MVRIKISTFRVCTICALMMMASWVGANGVRNDYRPSVDFTRFQTFMWIKEPTCVDSRLKQEIIDGINVELEAKGLYLASNNADLAVSANIATGESYSLKDFYEDFPSDWNWQHYLGPGSATKFIDMYKRDADTYKVGTLEVDLFDAKQKQVVWWGTANKFVYENAVEGRKQIMEVLVKMFSGNEWWVTMP